jgi:hypothetical protein
MNLKELVDVVSSETGLPAGQVRKICLAVLEKFSSLIDSQTDFVSPIVSFKSFTSEAKPASDDNPARPERKFARMTVRSTKEEPAG